MGNTFKPDPITIGYRYYMTLHMGISRGPVDEIVQINVGDVRAWPVADGNADVVSGRSLVAQGPNGTGVALNENGTYQTVSASAINTVSGNVVTQINAGNLFGGDKKEGGVAGSLTVLMGAATQVAPAWIKNLIGGRVSDFRGVCTFIFDGLLCSLNPYPKAWKVRVRRTNAGWDGAVWQPSLAAVWMRGGTIKAMNGAHILYECLTNRDWGRGFPRSFINEPALLKVAQTLHEENFGLCLRWNRQDELSDFIQDVINHIGGSLYVDRTTGLLTVDLLRGDYDPDDLPTFTYDTGLLSVEDAETASRDDAVNEIIVGWNDPINNEDRQARIQNLASLQSLGATNSTTTAYPGLPTVDLALRVAQRDLKASTTSLKRYKVTLDRRAHKIIPGKPFRISAPDKNIFNVILRAGKVGDGVATDGKITVECVLDVFGLAAASFIAAPPDEWSPPDRAAKVVSTRYLREATYGEISRRLSAVDLAALDPTSGTIATMGAKPSSLTQGYSIVTMVAGEEFTKRGSEIFVPAASTSSSIGVYDTVIPFDGGIDLGLIVLGTSIQIDAEICRVDAIDTMDNISGTITIARGCQDTLPEAHANNTPIFFFANDAGTDAREYVSGETVDAKLLSFTSTQELSLDVAPTDSVTIAGRQGRPWAPGNLEINGTPYASLATEITGNIALTWSHRDRTLIQDQLVEYEAPGTTLEAGTTYTVRIYDGLSALVPTRTVSGITGAGYTYTGVDAGIDNIGELIVFEVEATRGGLASLFKYRFSVDHEAAGYGENYGGNYGG